MSTREPITHELKCYSEPFAAVVSGAKPFEWRKDDRDYRVGDTLRLMEWDPDKRWKQGRLSGGIIGYTGDECCRTVTYIIREGFGIPEGYCIMGLAAHLSTSNGLTEEEIASMAKEVFSNRIAKMEASGHWSAKFIELQRGSEYAMCDFYREALRYARDRGMIASPVEPVVTHLNMDPNASPETKEAVRDMIQAAYSYKPPASPPLTEEEAPGATR